MKTKRILQSIPFIVGLIVVASFYSFHSGGQSTLSGQGQASSVGSLGELGTCSRGGGALCHASSVGGLADNAGPGGVTLTAVPALTNNNYVPNQLYHMTVTVTETGKTRFGFGCEILDNSGSTDGHVNNTAGTVTVTDAVNTQIWQAYGTGRLSVTHSSAGGFATNSASFIFDWKAPATGTVNVFLAANAANNNAKADAADNVYLLRPILTPIVTGILPKDNILLSLSAYPVPATDVLNVALSLKRETHLSIGLYSISGQLIRTLTDRSQASGDFSSAYSLAGLSKGMYFLKINYGDETSTKRIIIQ
jgi:hypothetical protein